MHAERDLLDQLDRYGAWLARDGSVERQCRRSEVENVDAEVGLRVVESNEDDVLLDVVRRHRARRPRRWVLTVAAAGVVALGAAGLVLDARRDTRDPAADAPVVKASQSPVDPPGPLYVLPAELADVDNPFVESQALQPYSGLVIGQRSGEGFRNPVHVTVLDSPPVDVEDTWTPVEVATGVAYVRHDGPVMRVAQQRGDGWLLITGDDTDGQVRTDLLDGLTISADGTIDVDAGIDVVGRFAGTAAGTAYSTYLELGDGIVVETATVAESAFGGRVGRRRHLDRHRHPRHPSLALDPPGSGRAMARGRVDGQPEPHDRGLRHRPARCRARHRCQPPDGHRTRMGHRHWLERRVTLSRTSGRRQAGSCPDQ